jgi:hypothetical protein
VTGRLPAIEPVVWSATVIVRAPAVFRSTPPVNVLWPLSPAWKAYDAGRTACGSFEPKSAVPR